MRIIVFGLLSLVAAAAHAQAKDAQDDKVHRGPPPDWTRPSALLPVPASPSGAVFIRRQDLETH
ncbi:hypothetical protein ACI4B7_27185, partial [Klebsiella pneumoniae]